MPHPSWKLLLSMKVKVLVAQSCLTLVTPWTVCIPPGSSVHGILHGMGSPFLLQGIFQTQGSNPGLLYCRDSLLAEPPGKPFTQQPPLFPPVEHSQNDALTLHTHMWISIIKKLSLPSFSFFRKKKDLFIYFWLHWVFVAALRLSLLVVNGLSFSQACGILPDQGSNLRTMDCKADS